MATAYSYQSEFPDTSVYTPSTYGGGQLTGQPESTGKSFWSKLVRGLTGLDEEQYYQNALTANNRAYEQAMIQSERDFQNWFDSTAVQRRVADIKAAGLNPWLALQSGGVSANGTVSGSQPGAGSSAKRGQESNSSALAMLLASAAKLIATLG